MSFIPVPSTPGSLDAFYRLRVSTPQSIFDSKLIADNDPSHWDDQQISGAGTTSTYNANQSSVTLAVSAATAGTRARQTYRRFTYQAAKSQLFSMTGILGTPATGITRRIGAFDGSNGVFFESGPSDVAVVTRSSTSGAPVDTRVTQVNWNYDKMDGSGPSGVTLDFTKAQIFVFDFQWLGSGDVRFGFDIGGFQLAHTFENANANLLVYMTTPNNPLRYEISSVGGGSSPAANMLQICSGVISEGNFDTVGTVRSVSRDTAPLVTLNNNSLYPLLSIRMRSGYEGANIRPIDFSFLSTTNSNIEAQLLLNPTITGPALAFTPLANSSVEADAVATNASTVTGGTLFEGAMAAAGGQVNLPTVADFQLGVSITGVRDILVLAVRRLTGATETIYGSLAWREHL